MCSPQVAEGDPPNLKSCPQGQGNDRMRVETVLSMMTLVSHLKHVRHRCWDYLLARLAFMVTAVNILLQWVATYPMQSDFSTIKIKDLQCHEVLIWSRQSKFNATPSESSRVAL